MRVELVLEILCVYARPPGGWTSSMPGRMSPGVQSPGRALLFVSLSLVLRSLYATRPPPPPMLELNGACAGIKQRETWKSTTGEPHWSYRIKVQPWTVFGRVRVLLHGWDMTVTKNYSCAVDSPVGRDITAVLHPRPGLDDTFQILGTGEPYADPDLSCEALQDVNSTDAECPLGPRFVVDSDWDSLQRGRFRAGVHLELWVLQTILTLNFGTGSKVTIGRDLSGARLTEGGDGTSSTAVVSLLPLKHCLGMYKDASCDNSFSFSAVVTPSMRALPRISCLLTRDMPAPPPPSPPGPPPSPPPGYVIDPNLCYLGGTSHYVVAPHKVAAQAALQTWVVAVHLNSWKAGLRIVLDFPGVMHAEHGLHVHSVYPAEVARLVSVTRHSAIVELLPTAARDFRFEALGDVEEVRVVCDIGDARPPPPPPPAPPTSPPDQSVTIIDGVKREGEARTDRSTQVGPGAIEGQHDPPPVMSPPPPPPPPVPTESKPWGLFISVALLAFIGYHAQQAQKDPTAYMTKAAEYVRSARMQATKTPVGRKMLMKVSTSSIGAQILQIEARYLGLPGSGNAANAPSAANALTIPAAGKVVKAKKGRKAEEDEEQQEPLVGQPQIEGFGDDDDDDDDDDHDAVEEQSLSAPAFPPPREPRVDPPSPAKVRSDKIELIVKVGGVSKRRDVDLSSVNDMGGLQRLVATVCKRLGTDMSSGGLRMQYTDAHGQTVTVSRSTTIETLRSAKALLLLPKENANARKGSGGSGQSGRTATSSSSARARHDAGME